MGVYVRGSGGRRGGWGRLAAAAAVLGLCGGARGEFRPGEAVPLARRAEFGGRRTLWHDVLGRHTPHFARDRWVALPLPEPREFAAGADYKLSLSFDGGRHLTGWLPLLPGGGGAAAPSVPVLHVTLEHSGPRLLGVRAVVERLDARGEAFAQAFWASHDEAEAEWVKGRWPKHLVIDYRWEERAETDAEGALAGLLLVSLALSGLLIFSALRTSKDALSLASFARSMATEGDLHGFGSAAERGAKGD